jgi:hypothetical protein
MSGANGAAGPLRRVLEAARGPGISMKDLTVLSTQIDPYRLDTAAGHRYAQWFLEQFQAARHRRIHLRGLHYSIVARGGVPKPNGQPYLNDDANWEWLQAIPAKTARWLSYVPFTAISDERNAQPIIHRQSYITPTPWVSIGAQIEIPDIGHLEPYAGVSDFSGRQPYHLVIFGEKSSLANVVVPIAQRYHADAYLPTGEISDTLLYQMAADGTEDGRPMQVFTLSDCDPAGYQMSVSIGRKLQAFRDLLFPDLQFEVRHVALTVEQVAELGLPSTPLKETERRADRWRAAFGVEQTEIDALATLQPQTLARIIRGAIAPFYDASLDRRVYEAREKWEEQAAQWLADRIDTASLERIKAAAEARLAGMRTEIEAINEQLRMATDGEFDLPPIEVPEPEIDTALQGKPLLSSDWSWSKQTQALKDRKGYLVGEIAG